MKLTAVNYMGHYAQYYPLCHNLSIIYYLELHDIYLVFYLSLHFFVSVL